MSTPFLGEIRMFAGNFAPRSWAFCDGSVLMVDQNDALFSLLGTTYGGDGRFTFGLPDMRGRIPIHVGQGPGLSNRRWGESGGSQSASLAVNQLPAHRHVLKASADPADSKNPRRRVPAVAAEPAYETGTPPLGAMNAGAIGSTGGGLSHDNEMPYLCVHFIIALGGIYPSRT